MSIEHQLERDGLKYNVASKDDEYITALMNGELVNLDAPLLASLVQATRS